MYTVVMPLTVDVAARPTAIRVLRRGEIDHALRGGRTMRLSLFSAIDDPCALLMVLSGCEVGDDVGWLSQALPPGAVGGQATVCRPRHWYWNASLCAMSAAFTVIEAAPPRAEGLIREIDALARTGLATRRGFVDFQLLQGIGDPGHVGVLHEWQTGDLLAAARHDTAEALDRIASDAGSRAIRYVSVHDAVPPPGVNPGPA